jgi:hypothetical protein
MKQLNQHRTRDWVKPGDATVIALCGAMIPSARSELTVPRIIRSVLPFGSEAFRIDRDTMEVVDRGFEYRPTVTKRKGAPVAVDIFADETHSMISALLASCADEINRPVQAGADFVLIHNPHAAQPLPRGWLSIGREYWIDGQTLHERRHLEPDT